MAVVLKASTASNTTSILVPTGTVVGDLLVLCQGNYNSTPSTPSGWTLITGTAGTGTYTDNVNICWKIATASETPGASITITSSGYSGAIMSAFSGHDTTTPITATFQGGASYPITVPSITTAKTANRYAFASIMGNSGSANNIYTPSGWNNVLDIGGSTGTYHYARMIAFPTTTEAAGTYTGVTATVSVAGGNVGAHFAVNNGNAAPTASNLSPSTFRDNRVSTDFTWTYTDAESDAQNAYEIRYRPKDNPYIRTGTAQTFSYTGAQQTYVVPAGVTKVLVEAYGASGNDAGSGNGGFIDAAIDVTPGETLYAYVGQGLTGGAAYNGGAPGAGGGTDVRRGGTALANRVVVSGGGGAGYASSGIYGGHGGGLIGGSGSGPAPGTGGSQVAGGSAGGSLGQGGSTNYYSGGGGYYGGGSSPGASSGGGGGSSYSSGTIYNNLAGQNVGNGSMVITPIVGYDWTTVTVSSSQAFHTFAADTFVFGEEYKWQVRVSDAVAGYVDWSTLTYFLAGTSVWTYEPEIVSSTTSSQVPFYQPTFGTFENSTDIANGSWGSVNPYGAYVPATIARSTIHAATGTYSLEVTLPTTTTVPSWANCAVGLTPGSLYEISAKVWVPTGVSPVELDAVSQGITSNRSNLFDQWQTLNAVFIAGLDFAFAGVKTVAATTSGQKFYIDDFTIRRVELPPGDYIVEVMTSDGIAYSPWSSYTTFTVNTPPTATAVDVNPKNIGGNTNVTWTYADVNSNAQNKYQIRRRRRT